jgi:hypothetical protein
VISVDASKTISTNPHPNPYNDSRSISSVASCIVACLDRLSAPMFESVCNLGFGGVPHASSSDTNGCDMAISAMSNDASVALADLKCAIQTEVSINIPLNVWLDF